ncbi:hypothetical protein niasHS_013905 [Heterodera schachtii]|uniref:Uncharacterized protein n=1 Tax=Heterodera schachtii TaxID=97005 RepID=A0ABD2J1Z6_HETSC
MGKNCWLFRHCIRLLTSATPTVRLLFVPPFTDVSQYLHELEIIGHCMHWCGSNALIYLAAAVSDFYKRQQKLITALLCLSAFSFGFCSGFFMLCEEANANWWCTSMESGWCDTFCQISNSASALTADDFQKYLPIKRLVSSISGQMALANDIFELYRIAKSLNSFAFVRFRTALALSFELVRIGGVSIQGINIDILLTADDSKNIWHLNDWSPPFTANGVGEDIFEPYRIAKSLNSFAFVRFRTALALSFELVRIGGVSIQGINIDILLTADDSKNIWHLNDWSPPFTANGVGEDIFEPYQIAKCELKLFELKINVWATETPFGNSLSVRSVYVDTLPIVGFPGLVDDLAVFQRYADRLLFVPFTDFGQQLHDLENKCPIPTPTHSQTPISNRILKRRQNAVAVMNTWSQ